MPSPSSLPAPTAVVVVVWWCGERRREISHRFPYFSRCIDSTGFPNTRFFRGVADKLQISNTNISTRVAHIPPQPRPPSTTSMDGPCSVVRNGGMRGFNSSGGGGSLFCSREQAHQQQAVRFGVAFAAPAAPATASSAVWDANDEPLPDILSGPTLRSVSSLVMSLDAEEGSVSAAARNHNNNNTNSGTNKNTSNSNTAGAAKDVAVSGGMVDMLMTPLPAPPTPMDTNDQLTREQSFPPPFRTRLNRDQSFPPLDMLSSSSSLRSGWATAVPTPTSNSNTSGGGSMAGGGGLFMGSGGAPSLSKFSGLGYPAPPLTWGGGPEQDDAPGGQVHGGGGNGGPSLGNEGQHGVYYDPPPPSSHRQRHPSFDKLAEMIPGIPHWTTPCSPSAPAPPSAGAPPSAAREQLHGDGGAGGGGSSSSGSIKAEAADGLTPASSPSRATPPTRGRQQHPTSTRPENKTRKQHQRRPDSPTRARWSPSATSPGAAVAAVAAGVIAKRPPSSGTGKRSAEPPLSCGPVRPGGELVDLAQHERRRVKIQRYLYKRSRRKFAKITRDASPSRSRPKAAAKRPRVKGKFVRTAPDFISVNHPREDTTGVAATDQQDAASPPSRQQSPVARGVGGSVGAGAAVGGQGRRGGSGGGVCSVRNGGSVNINFNGRKAFSSIPPSSLLPRGGGAGCRAGRARLPPVSTLAPHDGAPNAFFWETDSMSM